MPIRKPTVFVGGGITLAENVAVDVPTSVLQWQNRSEGTGRSYAGNGSTVPDGLTKAWQIVGIDENGQVIIKEYTDPYNGYTYHDGNAFKTVRIGDYGTPGNTSGSYDKIYFGTVADSVTGLAIGNYADNISSESTIENNSPFYSASGIAIGDYSRAKERFAIAFGSAASATGQGSMALGTAAGATGMGSVAIGRQSAATNDASLALGTASSSQGTGSVAVGHSSHAVGDRAIAIGTTSGNKGAVNSTKGTPYDEAHNTEAIGDRSIAFGIQAETTENASDSYAIGNTTKIDGSKAIGIGYQTTIDNGSVSSATDNNSIAIGAKTVIKGVDNVTEGNAVKVTGSGNVLQGSNMTVKGANNVVQGSGNKINADTTAVAADDSVVQGNDNTIVGERDLVRGSSNIVQGSHNTVDSYEGKVYGNNNIAIGESTEIGTSSQTISNGVAVGYNSSVTADGGIALGSGSVASTASGAVGYDPTTRTASTKTDAAWKSTQGAVSVSSGSDASRQIVGVAAGTNDTDAVNVAQLKANTTKVAAGTNVTVQETTDSTTGGKIYTVNSTAMQSFKVNHNGTETATIGDGSVVNFKDGTNTKAVVTKTDSGVNVQYDLGDNVATKDDGLKFAGDDGQTDSSKVISKKLNEQVDVVGGADANTLTDGNIGVNNVDGKLKVQLNKDVNLTDTGSVTIGGIKLANQSIANTKGTSETGNYLTGLANKTWNPDTNGYVSGRAATEDQLKSVSDVASAHTKVAAGNHVTVNESTDSSTGVKTYTVNADLTGLGGMDSFKVQGNSDAASEVKISDGKIVDFKDSDNLAASISKKSDDTGVEVTYDLKDDINIGKAGADGKDGTIGVNGKDGSAVVINGKDGSIGLNGKDGANGLTIKGADGKPGLDGKDGVTRLIYETKDGETIVTHEVATLDDGMKYAGDFGDTSKVKLNKQVNVKGNAENEVDLTDKNIGVVSSQDGDDGQLLIKLNKDIDLTEAGSVKIGNTDINNDGLTIHNTDTSKNITIKNGDISMGGNTITHVDAGVNDTDAVNVSQLNDVKTLAGKHTEVTVEGGTAAGTGKDDSGKDIYAGENLKLHVTDTDGLKTYDLKLADAINIGGKDGKDGHIGVNGKDGKDGKDAVAIDGKDGNEGHIGLKGKDGENGTDGKDAYSDISTHYGPVTLNPKKNVTLTNGTTAATRIHYTDQDGKTHEVATMDDGQVYGGDTGTDVKRYLNEKVNIKGGIKDESKLSEADNIGVVADGSDTLKIRLAKNLQGLDSVRIGGTKNTDGTWTGGIYIANQTAQYTKDGAPGENENGNYVIGLDNKTWNPKGKGIVSGRAATEDQLKMVQDSITNVEQGGGFGLKAEDNQTVKKNLGQTVTVKGDGKNIETKVANGDVQIALKRDINVDSVTFGDKTGIKISQEGLSLGNGTTNHQITNMASGANDKDSEGNPVYDVDTNGANIGDVKNIANSVAEGVKAKSGKNITVDSNNQVNLNDHIVMGDGNGTVGSGDAAKQVEIAGSEASLRAGSGDNKVSIDGKSGTLDVGDNDNGLVTVGGDSGVKLGKQTIANHDASEPNAAEGKYLTGLENTKWDRDHIVSGRAATEDQLKEVDRKVNGGRVFKGDDGQEVTVGLGETMNLKGGADSTKLTDNNIGVVKDGDNGVAIKLSKDISGLNSITINNVDNTRHVTIQGDHIDMGGNKITNVQDGEISSTSKDAVNGSQLYQTNLAVNNIGHAVNELDNRVDRVGAGAAALAALHPLDFDPDEKWDFAAGYGNYRGADAVAVGAYYRPNEDTMFSVGGSFGGGENMVNAGVSFKIGQGNHVSTSRVAMAKEIKDLRKELENLKSAMVDAAAHREIDTSKLQLFPDVPANHWAYEYVATLAGNGIVEGYPDGNFSGDRPMTRYEFAAMLYRAMLKGAVLSDRILNEFAPELERFRVDTIYKDKNGNPTVERVRVIKRNQQTK